MRSTLFGVVASLLVVSAAAFVGLMAIAASVWYHRRRLRLAAAS